ncbi:CaiB/BaiF CoA transferase family protein [Shewanella psychrotolerans]|uniref:CaiB/BaiF CoA transferase family protein n=1 Tax=Shewanella psychrotolerans TaxID=2864206 RepID=UPI001C6590C1|nr:CaiB/BaiF CoA-transferase family protein [Shewanella psychrotolerans]QYK01911.1 CoA transferase [Shewanella psychrotolerans]
MAGILEGIRVIEVASMAAAPSATVMLADHGAEVIKIEPLAGDPWRYGHMVAGMPKSKIAYTTYTQNRTKKSVALDLKKPEAQEALLKLVATADVFLTNSPRNVQKHLKHTYEDIKAVNPEIVYAWINGFGLEGPDKDAPGFDMTAWYARTGIMEELRPKEAGPVPLPVGTGDLNTATALFSAVMTGLFHKERTGKGSKVSTSLMNNGLWANSSMMQAALVGAPAMKKYHREEWPNPVTGGVFKTQDNRYVIIVELNPNNVDNLRDAFGADHLKGDERFATPELRAVNHQALFDEMQAIVGLHDLAKVKARLKEFGVNFSVVQTTEECTRDEHMIANGCFPEVEGTEGIRTIDSPIQVEGNGINKVKPQNPPKVGEHTISALTGLGYSEEEVQALVAAKAVGLPR